MHITSAIKADLPKTRTPKIRMHCNKLLGYGGMPKPDKTVEHNVRVPETHHKPPPNYQG